MEKGLINIKGTRNGLVICLEPTRNFDDLKKSLRFKIESARGFFKGAKFVFHLGVNPLPADITKELEDICCEHGLIPDHGITWPASNLMPEPAKAGRVKTSSAPAVNSPTIIPDQKPEKAVGDNVRPLLREASPSLPSVGLTKNDKKSCLLVQRSLRSGQKINFKGNVVIMGDVNPGSEVTATGDVVVMGSMRGIVHAGADGNVEASIMAYRLNPVQLRIASVITRPPENNLLSGCPEIARLHQGRMFIEPYITSGLKQRDS